ncbi:MAG: NADH-quinone oxidoreductase subunit N [Syntrophales bacterium]|nr:NADH-quinone oxidoreductase subunit N [Syntrophales bacterium]MCK9392583.1 NADH-quinone oxidoreductase subunit N [Syntrophales bacterium]
MIPQDVNLYCLLPEIILLAGATTLLFIRGVGRGKGIVPAAVLTVFAALAAVCYLWDQGAHGLGGLIVKDNSALMFQVLILTTALISFVLARDFLPDHKNNGEYYSLLLFSLIGMGIMTSTRDLLVIFLGIEILSLSLYVLVGFMKIVRAGMEGAVKYFLLGSFASALFLLGLALSYGATGTTNLAAFAAPSAAPALLLAGAALMLIGLGFKIAAAPFHMWAPDAYEGAPVCVAAFMSVAPKIAVFAVLLRFGTSVSGPGQNLFSAAVIFMSVASMVIGNFTALRQASVVRMLAYSGIAQAGYILIGLLAIPEGGAGAIAFYLMVYIFMNMGAFASLAYLSRRQGKALRIDDLAGLASRHPWHAFALAVFMVSLAGIPPTGGFFAKFYLFKVGIEAGYLGVVLIAIVATIVSFFYYLRIVMVMYMTAEGEGEGLLPMRTGVTMIGVMIAAIVIMTFLTGIMPDQFFRSAATVFTVIIPGV